MSGEFTATPIARRHVLTESRARVWVLLLNAAATVHPAGQGRLEATYRRRWFGWTVTLWEHSSVVPVGMAVHDSRSGEVVRVAISGATIRP